MNHHAPIWLIVLLTLVSIAAAAPYFLVAIEFRRAINAGKTVITPELRSVLQDFRMWLELSGSRFLLGIALVWVPPIPRYVIGSVWILLLGFYEWRCYFRIKGRADLYLALLANAMTSVELTRQLGVLEKRFEGGPQPHA